MTMRQIRAGRWYETRLGYGEALEVGGRHPPAVKLNIVSPYPRGTQYVAPKDVLREATEMEAKALLIGCP